MYFDQSSERLLHHTEVIGSILKHDDYSKDDDYSVIVLITQLADADVKNKQQNEVSSTIIRECVIGK